MRTRIPLPPVWVAVPALTTAAGALHVTLAMAHGQPVRLWFFLLAIVVGVIAGEKLRRPDG